MPLFFYTVVSQEGKRASGTKEAADASELARALRQEGFILTSAKAQGKHEGISFLRRILDAFLITGRVPLLEKMMFARHLALMVKAGFSLNKALQVLALQTKNRRFAKIITSLEGDVRQGNSFGDSLAKYPDIFSDLFVNMVKAGESSGNLEENLKVLGVQMKKEHELKSKVKSAMLYPAVILVAMFGIGTGMMIFVMPKLISVFKELNAELPLTTRFVIWLSEFLSRYWFFALLAAIGIFFAARLVLRTKKGKDWLDRLILKMPLFGNISKKVTSASLARTLSSLIESGIPIVKALEISASTLTNSLFNHSIIEASRQVQKGQPLSQILSAFPYLYPPMVSQMIQVGEETGTLGEITERLAEFYEEEVANITKSLSSIIEPILMVIIGAAVGFFAVSMIQPMYSMMDAV